MLPAFLPSVPLPVGMVRGGMMYMYSCSQCDFQTHVEQMFKQHVDSVHLGIGNPAAAAANNVVLSQQNVIATAASTGGGIISPMAVTAATMAQGAAANQTLVVTTPATGVQHGLQKVLQASPTGGFVTGGVTAAAATTAAAAATAGATAAVTTVHKCPKCGFLAPSKNQLTQHRRKVHGKAATQQAYQQAQAAGGQVLSSAAAATSTGTNASGKKTYQCSTCGYSTTRRDGLSQHYDSVHLKIKSHQCNLCPYAASQKGTLNRHVKLRHKKKDDELGGLGQP